MAHRRLLPLLAALAALAACGVARDNDDRSGSASACTGCHGGAENESGAPPRLVRDGGSAGAHSAHVAAGLTEGEAGCTACHPDPRAGSTSHMTGAVDFAFGPLATAGGTVQARWDAPSGSCASVYCHGAFPGGNAGNAPRWSDGAEAARCGTCHGNPTAPLPALPATHPALAPGLGMTVCSLCHSGTVDATGALIRAAGTAHSNGVIDADAAARHPAGWLVRTSPDFHGRAAAQDVRACSRCHAAKGTPTLTTVVCADCHDGLAGGKDWTVTCNTCHGSSTNAAPPRDTSGNTATTARGVGAHQAHLAGSTGAPAFACEFCHAVPSNVYAAGHLDGSVTVTGYTGTDATWAAAVRAPGFDAPSATCGTAYCHGAFRQGNAANAPLWTAVGQGEAACGTCHALPPPAPHPAAEGGPATCSVCHSATLDPAGALIAVSAGGLHLNGVVDATGHDTAWMEPTSDGFHARSANAGLAPCMRCHGDDLAGGATGVACADCHGATWKTNCTMCHGGEANATGAPPKATCGNRSPAGATNVRVGAHTKHVSQTVAPAIACGTCHPARTSALDADHVGGGTATVTFGGLATNGGQTSPTWDRATATCASTYCHGKTLPGGPAAAPPWTSTGGGCGMCHGLPPPAPHPAVSTDRTGCISCHGTTVDAAGNLLPPSGGGRHMNGTVDGGHNLNWMVKTSPDFHAFSANRSLASCATCHGPTLGGDGARVPACANCHGTNWATGCTMCHGGTANASGAPPKATWGNNSPAGATNVRIGAHTTHVAGTGSSPAFGCEACHVKPATPLAAGHADSTTAEVTFSGLAVNGTSPTWSRTGATCANTYCHDHGGANPTPVWTASLADGCGSCHGAPPVDTEHRNTHWGIPCLSCHPGYTSTSASPAKHVNGTKDVTNLATGATWTKGWTDCGPCHTF